VGLLGGKPVVSLHLSPEDYTALVGAGVIARQVLRPQVVDKLLSELVKVRRGGALRLRIDLLAGCLNGIFTSFELREGIEKKLHNADVAQAQARDWYDRFPAIRQHILTGLERYIETAPDDFEARLLLGSHLGTVGDYHGATKHLEAAIALRPGEPMAYYSLAALYYGALTGGEFDPQRPARLGLSQEIVEFNVYGGVLAPAERASINRTMEMGKRAKEALGLGYDDLERKAVSLFAKAFELGKDTELGPMIVGHLNNITGLRATRGGRLAPGAHETVLALIKRYRSYIARHSK